MKDLKGCPFCGSNRTAVRVNTSRSGKSFYYVSCEVCGARTRGEAVDNEDNKKVDIAIERSVSCWNQRTVIADA